MAMVETMVETGYRYSELYWAGQDQNWQYADYQLEKIPTAIESGLERRPKRVASAQTFLNEVMPQVKRAIEAEDTAQFRNSLLVLQAGCRSCYVKEKVAFIQSGIPEVRLSPIRFEKINE